MDDRPYDFDIDPASFVAIGALGPPGRRTFYLQAAQGSRVVTLVIEKGQAVALAASVERLLVGLEVDAPGEVVDLESPASGADLLQPLQPEFRVVEMGLGVDEEREMIVLVALEAPDDEPGRRARIVANYEQMRALARSAIDIAEKGRPMCPLCGRPINPEGHFCPRTNGHAHPPD